MGSASVLSAATLPDALTFVIAAVVIVIGALGVVFMKNPVHSALMLVMTLFSVAVLFVEENAQFLAAVQVIVYAGAIVVLFLFVIMLIGVDRREIVLAESFRGQRVIAMFLGACVIAEVVLLARGQWVSGSKAVTGSVAGSGSNVARLGRLLFTSYLLPFEVTSALLVVAVVGAVVLSRTGQERAGSDEERADESEPLREADEEVGSR